MTAPAIAESVRVYDELRARLLSDDPDLDEVTLADTLEGATDLQERIVRICRASVETSAFAAALDGMIKDLGARKKRMAERSDRLRSIALWAMQEASIPKITAPDATISIGKGRASIAITDEGAIPPHLVEYEPKPNRAAIKEALDAGEIVPGASLTNSPPSLIIRVK